MVLPTPIAAYNFNDSGATLTDVVGSNDGSISGASFQRGPIAWERDFDGINDQVSFSTFGTSVKAIRLLFNIDTLGRYLLHQASGVSIYVDGSNKLVIADSGGNTFTSTNSLSTGTDYDLFVSFDGASSLIYLNGSALAGTNNLTGTTVGHASNTVYLGSDGSSSYHDGGIWNLIVTSSAVSSTDIVDAYNSGTNKIYTSDNGWIDDTNLEYGQLWYSKLESTTITDEVAGNNGTSYNAPSSVTGKIGNGIDYARSSSQYSDGPGTTLVSSAGSISIWFYKDSMTGDQVITGMTTSAVADHLRIEIRASGDLRCFIANEQSSYAAGISTGSWHHVVLTWDETTTWKAYLDGVLRITGSASKNPANTVAMLIGCGNINTGSRYDYFDGPLDELGVWSYQLSSTQVSSLYASGSPGSSEQYPYAAAAPGTPEFDALFYGCNF